MNRSLQLDTPIDWAHAAVYSTHANLRLPTSRSWTEFTSGLLPRNHIHNFVENSNSTSRCGSLRHKHPGPKKNAQAPASIVVFFPAVNGRFGFDSKRQVKEERKETNKVAK
jgi:hypothetical protein